MCNIQQGFKLCTCRDISEEEADWILLKSDHSDMHYVIGSITDEYRNYLLDHRWIEHRLNSGESFDFKYEPSDYDRLVIRTNNGKNEELCFIYQADRWVMQELYSNEGYREILTGRLE